MPQSLGIETLIEKRANLVAERDNMLTDYNNQIAEIESCIELLSGKKVWEVISETKYDDENPNYIRSSQEEI